MNLLKVDGAYGEGGGQILRTSLALAALIKEPVEIYNIRAGKRKPGLKPQHLMSAMAVAEITGGSLEGNELNSQTLRLFPGAVRGGRYTFDVSTLRSSSGSTGLIFQTILPALSFAERPSEVTIRGGTHVPWSPPSDYLKCAFLPTAGEMGIKVGFENTRYGFYPLGGGEIKVGIGLSLRPLKPISLIERGELKRLYITSAVANLPISIAERQRDKAIARIRGKGLETECAIKEVPSPGKGTFVFILAEFEDIRIGFSSLGAVGKKAEAVADEAVDEFLGYLNGSGATDPHIADQLILYMALADGESTITTTEVTNHLLTNIHVIERFLPARFKIEEGDKTEKVISVKGIGLTEQRNT
ncbi:MAG: RNA 3'-terminal phosphate cyclase [Thermodesulfobacteriota bacterium]